MEYLCEMRDATVVFINLSLDHGHDHSRCIQGLYDGVSAAVLQFQGKIRILIQLKLFLWRHIDDNVQYFDDSTLSCRLVTN